MSAVLTTAKRFVDSISDINEIRAREPQRIKQLLANRRRRPLFGDDGKLMIVACDHPARGALEPASTSIPCTYDAESPTAFTIWADRPRCNSSRTTQPRRSRPSVAAPGGA